MSEIELLLTLVQNVQSGVNSLDAKMERHYESFQNQLASFHTPGNCESIKEVKIEVKKLRDQQHFWLGGLAVIGGIVGVLVTFKDEIVGIFRR